MSFGWSIGDLLAALGLLNKVRIALTDSHGASAQFQEELAFLQNIAATLEHLRMLEVLPLGALDPVLLASLQQHCQQIRGPLQDFLKDIQDRFFRRLGNKTSWWNARTAPRKVQWALSTSKKVTTLREIISGNLIAVQVALGQQTLHVSDFIINLGLYCECLL